MRKRFVLALVAAVLGILVAGGGVLASPELEFETLDVQVMPEYDQPSPEVLVIQWGRIVNKGTTPFEGELRFTAPAGAQWNSACRLDEQDNHFAYQWSQQEIDGKSVLTFKPEPIGPGEELKIHLEYYYPGVEGQIDKVVNYEFVSDYPVKALRLVFVEPKGSEGFSSTPPAVNSYRATSGYMVREYSFGAIEAGESVAVTFEYTREETAPSEVSAAGTSASGEDLTGTATLVFLGVVAVAAFALIGYYASRGGSKPARKKKRRKDAGPRPSRRSSGDYIAEERRKARQALLDGRISEETYRQILRDLERESRNR